MATYFVHHAQMIQKISTILPLPSKNARFSRNRCVTNKCNVMCTFWVVQMWGRKRSEHLSGRHQRKDNSRTESWTTLQTTMRGLHVIPLTQPSLSSHVLAHLLLIFTAQVLMGHWACHICITPFLKQLLPLIHPTPPKPIRLVLEKGSEHMKVPDGSQAP